MLNGREEMVLPCFESQLFLCASRVLWTVVKIKNYDMFSQGEACASDHVNGFETVPYFSLL